MSEPCRLRRGEGYGACADEGKHSPRLYAGRDSGRCPVPQPPAGGEKEEQEMPREKRKTGIVTMRMAPHTKEVLQEKAREADMTLTTYLCICGLGQQIIRVEGLDDLLSELKAQGRNLNQLTTLANMGRRTVLRGDDLISEYTRLCDMLGTLVREVR